jgi:hypothetical protein
VTFDVSPAGLTLASGGESVRSVLGGVTDVRVLSSQFGQTYVGDVVSSVLGLDDLRASHFPGDANFDGTVDFNDLVALAQHYNTSGGLTWGEGDFTFDGRVDFEDLVQLAQNYNTSERAAAALPGAFEADFAKAMAEAPEPGVVGIVAVAMMLGASRRRRRRAGQSKE